MDTSNRSAQSNEYHRSILDNISGGMQIAQMLYDDQGEPIDYLFLDVNSVFAEIMGLAKEEIIGKRGTDFFPDTESEWFIKYGEIVKSGKPETFEMFSMFTGCWYSVMAVPLGGQGKFAVISTDITKRKEMEYELHKNKERQEFQLRLSDTLRSITDAEDIKRTAAHIVGEYLGVDYALYSEITDNGSTIHIEDCYVRCGTKKILGDFSVSSFGAAMDVLRCGEPLIVEDQTTILLKNPTEREAGTSLGEYACMIVPFMKEGRWVANFSVLQGSSRRWTDYDLAILKNAAERIWEAAERAKAEKSLQKNEEMYRELVEFSPTGIYEIDIRTGRFLSVNDAVCNLLGYSREELFKMSPFELLDEDSRKRLLLWHNQWIPGEKVSPLIECRMQHKDGYYVDIQIQGYYISRENGKILRLVVMQIDITARKMAEKALRENEERQACLLKFSDILRSLSDPVEIHATVTGTAMDHFKSDRCYYCEIEDDKAIIRKDSFTSDLPSVVGVYTLSSLPVQKEIIEAGQPFSVSDAHTTEMVDEELRGIWIQQKIISYLHVPVVKGGKPVGLLCITQSTPRNWTDTEVRCAIEIAERTWGAVERAKVEEALRDSEERFRALNVMVPVGVAVSSDGTLDYTNPTYERMLGYGHGELVGTKASDLYLDPHDRNKWLSILKEKGAVQDFETRWKKKDGTLIWVLINVSPIIYRSKQGEIGTAQDITKRKRDEEALHKSEQKALALVAELEKTDKNKNQFLSVLSHELRNPLAVISAGIQVLNITNDISQIAKVNEIINRQTNQLCKLVDDLLELTRMNENKMKLKKEKICLNEVVKAIVEDSRFEFENKGVELETEIQAKQILLYADPVRLSQAIGNLLNNALKFTQQNGKVRVMLQQKNEDAVIIVKDNGIGLTSDILPVLFSPFTQADNSLDRRYGGLGLGLSIVKGIMDLHEGTVSAHSEGLGKGSAFTLRFPIATNGHFIVEQQVTDRNGKMNLKILIIEDNRDFANLLSTMLKTLVDCVDIAYDGKEGLKLAHQNKPDIVFCDIGLPVMDGYDVAASIKKDTTLKDVCLVALTGYAHDADTERALKAGFDKHLAKPVDIAILKAVLENNG